MKVLHVITGLGAGGAEAMLIKLLTRFKETGGPSGEVVCLTGPGPMHAPIAALGVPITCIGMVAGMRAFLRYHRLSRAVAASRADIVQTWMYHANLMGGLAARSVTRAPVVWGLRQSNLDRSRSKKRTILVARAGARLSRVIPDRIVCVSAAVRDVHAAMGYDGARMAVIPNGFDLTRFHPDADARKSVRAELSVVPDAPLVGLIARFDPQKDHGTFFQAARIVAKAQRAAAFVLCGEDVEDGNGELEGMVRDAGLGGRVHLLGRRDDIPRLTAALDVAVSSSAFGEGFSNTLGEALACGVPVVATDVGGSRSILGDAGRAVPPGDAAALGEAITALLALAPEERGRLGALGRQRMAQDFDIAAIGDRYGRLYDDLLAGRV